MLGKTMFFQDQAYCIYRNGMLEETCKQSRLRRA